MIVNSVRNILQGFGASSLQGGTNTSGPSAPDGTNHAINVAIAFPAGRAGISVGYAKVRVTDVTGAVPSSVEGLSIYASDGVHLPVILVLMSPPLTPPQPDGWEASFVVPFVGDYQFNSFSTNVTFDDEVTNAVVDFEVWGNAMAGGL